ncbi:uncharacterized protein LOC121850394 [Callorhinchus milii]|uniref:uncharacterized protein LOC121850394 n=1 Tax=Callorhinchus milii TaxID=7868 RepID=UPI001C3FF499|nr:uncharacterized protein LOC121850394 [Callorhinchus milii]
MLWLPVSAVLAAVILPPVQPFAVLVAETEIRALVGDAVTLSVRPAVAVGRGVWWFGFPPVVYWSRGLHTVSPEYRHRALLLPNTSLVLRAVRVTDTGDYTVRMVSLSGKTSGTASVRLTVREGNPAERLRSVSVSVLTAAALVSTLSVQLLSGSN